MIADVPTVWLERCIQIIDTDPATAQPAIGQPARPHLTETHRLACADCRNEWHPVESELSWYGLCANCGSDNLTIESNIVHGTRQTNEWHLVCASCGAGWVGIAGDPCWWCQRATQMQLDYQAELLLMAPDIDPADTNYDDRIVAWAKRMAVGVEAGIITETQAERAYRLNVKGIDAA